MQRWCQAGHRRVVLRAVASSWQRLHQTHAGGMKGREERRLEQQGESARITWVGLGTNVLLATSKIAVGARLGSTALVADGIHNASDIAGDIIALLTIAVAREKPSISFPYGYGKWEGMGTLVVSSLIIAGGLGTAYHSVTQLETVKNSGDLYTVLPSDPMVLSALGIAVASVVFKEALFRATVRIGKKAHSPVVIANAWHHRQDALTSLAAIIGIGGAYCGFPYLDPIAGFVVSGFIVKAGAESLWQAVSELTDRVTEDNSEIVSRIETIGRKLASEDKHFVNLHDVRLRRFGGSVLVDLHMVVRPLLSVTAAFHLGQHLKRRIIEEMEEVGDVFVHIDAGKDAFITRSLSFKSKSKQGDDDTDAEHHHPSGEFSIKREDTQELFAVALSQAEIESQVREVVLEESKHNLIRGISHCTVHYDDPRSANEHDGLVPVRIEVNLLFDPTITLSEANSAAKKLNLKLKEKLPFLKAVDLHVELDC